jgi:hypothetical protein
MNQSPLPTGPTSPAQPRPHVVHRVFQVEDAILDGVAYVILRVHHRGGHLLIGTALSQLLVLREADQIIGLFQPSPTSSSRSRPRAGALA